MLTPSLVMVGAPHFFSRTTLRPLGPSVTLTASASWFIPRSSPRRASSLKAISFGISQRFLLLGYNCGGRCAARDGRPGRTGGPFPPALLTSAQPVRSGGTLYQRVPASCLALAPSECKRQPRAPARPEPLASGHDRSTPADPSRREGEHRTRRPRRPARQHASGHFAVLAEDGTPAVIPTMVVRDDDRVLAHGSTG